ncbi:IS5 family transposase, partial [uncultured Desulfovibrio sp.]|uniref:IS5 family transposase n=1 Tax=uncultured Desulfovibrio sp. TaxID=167968 RepID=UPI002624EF83
MAAHRRHDISDKVWANIEKLLPGSKGCVGRPSADNRLFINAVFWILRTGAPWRNLPPDLGDWKNTHRRFCRWRDRGVWEKILEALIAEPDFEWLILDASHCKVHPHAAGAAGGNEAMKAHKRGLNSKIHLAVDARGMPVRVIVTEDTRADCKVACALIDGLSAGALLADRGYDTENILRKAGESVCQVVIPPKKSRKILRNYDRALYKVRHLVENAFLHLKRWRGIATRYAKRCSSFLAAVQIR